VHPTDRLRTTAALAALIGGLAWVVDTTVIAVIDDSFDPLDSILFLSGLAALVVMGGSIGALAGRRSAGMRRVLEATGVTVGLVAALTLVSIAADALSHALYHGSNRGLHEECGIFAIGVAALVLAALVKRAPAAATARAARPTAPASSAGRGSR
jgi:hypothetical protein